ncbi:hypothetical protein NKR19_g2700 [Coniochaeta hoffmannii]|uniref:DUF2470 domain-containing protein n=1 Tax=Coniochaeta hoffmannii TaxID=91930 RepID=A0AA38VMT8_9PEZI|nr:hypothetical protein NKR19_g2700 [Coniochaeta hoffmannii]
MSIPNDGSKERTLSHMNKDHQADLSAILRHQFGVVSPNPVLEDISLSSLTITTDGGATTHVVPISPPMSSWSDRRARLVEMTLSARAALSLDAEGRPVVVKTFLPPSGFGAVVTAGVVFYFACFAAVRLGWVRPGTGLWTALEKGGWFPGGAGRFVWVVETIFVPVLGVHVGECWWLDRTRLRRFGVERGGGLWWMWMARCFLEGFSTFGSFDSVVKGEREGKRE